ncbi:sperm microtubule associated protein 2-like isoform X1 [Haemorhous mexicanus]|uniref:sperm microtubule associated protein 2-like isoform X1 n=1 Tax=Haemorhous mexicanus TaxID=30427 RepID=UPI0028BD8AD1|nr:sperm microtubule associated protein 2-like isoform X1 [Haemorhous mexicanus]
MEAAGGLHHTCGPHVSAYAPCMCVYPRSRIEVLADPKPLFCQASSPTLVWGNQETIWTLSPGAMTATPSARTLHLCQPKKDFTKYGRSCRPVVGGNPLLPKYGYPSERLLRLSEPKKYLPAYLEQRSRETPEWPVSLAAQNYNASKRILQLAQPKALHPDFMPPREVPIQVSSLAISASASARVQKLAEPVIRELTCCTTHTKPGVMSPASTSSRKVIASARTIELSKPKQLHPKFMPARDPEWPVTKAARQAVATERIVGLAQPSSRPRQGLTALNPDAFKVKERALKAVCTPRLAELAQPIRR